MKTLAEFPKHFKHWREWHARDLCVTCGAKKEQQPYHCDTCYDALELAVDPSWSIPKNTTGENVDVRV